MKHKKIINTSASVEIIFAKGKGLPYLLVTMSKFGPWLFLKMINDLRVANTTIWKYVNDNTLGECVD